MQPYLTPTPMPQLTHQHLLIKEQDHQPVMQLWEQADLRHLVGWFHCPVGHHAQDTDLSDPNGSRSSQRVVSSHADGSSDETPRQGMKVTIQSLTSPMTLSKLQPDYSAVPDVRQPRRRLGDQGRQDSGSRSNIHTPSSSVQADSVTGWKPFLLCLLAVGLTSVIIGIVWIAANSGLEALCRNSLINPFGIPGSSVSNDAISSRDSPSNPDAVGAGGGSVNSNTNSQPVKTPSRGTFVQFPNLFLHT